MNKKSPQLSNIRINLKKKAILNPNNGNFFGKEKGSPVNGLCLDRHIPELLAEPPRGPGTICDQNFRKAIFKGGK